MTASSQLPLDFAAEHDAIWYGISIWPVCVRCSDSVACHLLVHPQTPHFQGSARSTVLQQLEHLCVINTVFITDKRYSTIKENEFNIS